MASNTLPVLLFSQDGSEYAKSRANSICPCRMGARISFLHCGTAGGGFRPAQTPCIFALYANAVHFAMWTLLLPFLVRCTRRFPLDGRRTRNVLRCLWLSRVSQCR